MQLVYSGAHPEVTVDELNDLRGEDVVIVNGKPVDVPDELAARLLEQNTWSKATVQTTTPSTDTTATADPTKGNN